MLLVKPPSLPKGIVVAPKLSEVRPFTGASLINETKFNNQQLKVGKIYS